MDGTTPTDRAWMRSEIASVRTRLAAAERVVSAADIAYSEMAFTLQDIMVPDRRKDDAAWRDVRSKTLAKAADELQAALAAYQETSGETRP